ncbi:hypothetical protein DM01DRAFT_1336275 [Hesseltinella vesiculosa]|uniref:Uncharacterized protein n=1 Tax=Hesseltinella vesiculosa TaxID=101127 RepID=A0A1X2GG34_9FUNG|nr:hypothetical protein DM01DRAFT_1336275 [Hesseltinella vesiculosa]
MRFTLISLLVLGSVASCQAVSVHGWWNTPASEIIEMTSSITVPRGSDPEHTYWMANGWSYGYMGMQHNTGTERRVLFSVWDNGNGSRVDVLKTGSGVHSGNFGGEGTGKQAYLDAQWVAGEPVHFRTTMQVNKNSDYSIITGYYRKASDRQWNLVAQMRAYKRTTYLTGLYSFLENFGSDRSAIREGLYGNNTLKFLNGTTTNSKIVQFTNTTPDSKDVWDQRMLSGNTAYMRIDGPVDKGAYPPAHHDGH